MNKLELLLSSIQKQIDEAESILNQISCLKLEQVPDLYKMSGVKRYDTKSRDNLVEEVNTWQYVTKTLLTKTFGPNHDHTLAFSRTIVNNRVFFDARSELKNEAREGRNTLTSILKAETSLASLPISESKLETVHSAEIVDNTSTNPKVFISHSSSDKSIIDSFVDNVLVLGLGLNKDDIAYTSNEVYGIEPGDDISKYIKANITAASVVLLMVSDGYKHSEVCLNEMGAAWALDKPFISVLLPDVGFDKVGWLTNFNKAIQINQIDQLLSLCQKMAGILNKISISNRLNAIHTYINKFINGLPNLSMQNNSTDSLIWNAARFDNSIKNSINKLGEFTLKELQQYTGIDYKYLASKVRELVLKGTLIEEGGSKNRRYRIKD